MNEFGINSTLEYQKEINMDNIFKQNFQINKSDYVLRNKHSSLVIWLTGLSGSGKSTIADELNTYFFSQSINSFILDGDNTRIGINSDLTFSDNDRKENIRRVAEISKLFNDAGFVIIASFISPFQSDRDRAKQIIGVENYFEVFINCPIEECEKRDVKGLYKKARNGEIQKFTGIDSPFEEPQNPNLIINTTKLSIKEATKLIIDKINL